MWSSEIPSASPELVPVDAVHCLVHPGFDAGEHPEFERNIFRYIDSLAGRVNDVLLIISDGESFDESQLQEWHMLRTIEGIAQYLSTARDRVRNNPPRESYRERYAKTLREEWLDERFLDWCLENIDMDTVLDLEREWYELESNYHAWVFDGDMETHDRKAHELKARGKISRTTFDVLKWVEKAITDLSAIAITRRNTVRKIRNPWRFFRIFQYAERRLWSKRVGEMFIADKEHPNIVSILPVMHFLTPEWKSISSGHTLIRGRFTPIGRAFNQADPIDYGNAAKGMDMLTADLSVSRNRKLETRQVDTLLDGMWYRITLDTVFHFSWEYRYRCVKNVASVVHARLEWIAWDDFFIAQDELTLLHEEDKKIGNI